MVVSKTPNTLALGLFEMVKVKDIRVLKKQVNMCAFADLQVCFAFCHVRTSLYYIYITLLSKAKVQ